MPPGLITQDPLGQPPFERAAWLFAAAFLFLTAGALYRQWHRRRHPEERALLKPVATAAGVTCVLVLVLFAGGIPLLVGAGLLMLQALREYSGLVGLKRAYSTTLAGFCLAGLLLAALGVRMTPAVLLPALFLAATLIPILTGRTDDSHRQVAAVLFGSLYIGLPLAYLVFIRSAAPWGLRLLLVVVTCAWTCDSCGYIVGSKLGGAKLAPNVSPGKTVSGAVAGIVGAIAAAVALHSLLALCWTAVQLVLLGSVIAVCAIWGDLIESFVKRAFAVKDAGTILPGFGGVLDRFDSLLISIPVSFYAELGVQHLAR
jgi:phosphatidate cytidylyltransferase